MVPRQLTEKQLRFATEIAMGKGKTAAYRAAYSPANGKLPSVYSNSKRTAKLPHVAAAVAELRLRYMPAEASMEALYQHGLAVMLELTNSDDARARFAAARFLCEEAGERRKAASSVDPEPLLQKLRELYQTLHDDSCIDEQQVADIEVEDGELEPGGQVAAESVNGKLEALETAECNSADEHVGPQVVESETAFELLPVPGRYPPQFRRVRVR
jgi:hypothetical protein